MDESDHLATVARRIGNTIQGQILDIGSVPVLVDWSRAVNSYGQETRSLSGKAAIAVTPSSGLSLIVTQTCDLQPRATISGRATLHVAPIRIEGAASDIAQSARRETSPRYVLVPWHQTADGEVAVADLDYVGPLDRGLAAEHITDEKPPPEMRRRLEHALGRPWSRPALPDDVEAVIRPIKQKVVDANAHALRRIFDEALFQVRVSFASNREECTVRVHLVPYQEWFPDVEPRGVRPDSPKDHVKIAERLCRMFDTGDPGPEASLELVQQWHALANWLEVSCTNAKDKEAARVRPDREFTVERVEVLISLLDADLVSTTDVLDLSHLSLEDGTSDLDNAIRSSD